MIVPFTTPTSVKPLRQKLYHRLIFVSIVFPDVPLLKPKVIFPLLKLIIECLVMGIDSQFTGLSTPREGKVAKVSQGRS